MIFIHIIHRLTKLFTLKHSCFSANFTLKRSWQYAETLLRSIYTYIYLYKKTCSWRLQAVNNYFLKSFLAHLCLLTTTIVLTACCKVSPDERIQNAALHLSRPPYRHFEQIPGNRLCPPAYFTCGELNIHCHQSSNMYQRKCSQSYDKSNSISHLYSGGK